MRNYNRIGQHARKFNQMEPGELALFIRAWMTMSGWRVRVCFGAIPDAATTARLADPSIPLTADSRSQIRSCQLAVQRAENYHWLRGNCLLRSLTLQSLLRAKGISSRLCLGVRPRAGNPDYPPADRLIEAHAWLEAGELTLGRRIPGEAAYDRFEGNS